MSDLLLCDLEHLHSEMANLVSSKAVLRTHEPLAKRTTLRVGGVADLYAEPASEADLSLLVRFCAAKEIPFRLLGRGSNLLIRDGGIRGLVVNLAHPDFARIEVKGILIRCGAGARLKALAAEARRCGLSGLEFLEGIPGSVGGALRMNAGAMGSATFETVELVRGMEMDGSVFERHVAQVPVQYRNCPLFKAQIALGAVFRGTPAAAEIIAERMRVFNEKRWETQPKEPSAGCVFKNPSTIPAGKLIEELGLKGRRIGGAVVSPTHGNFIINDGDATANDVLELIELMQETALRERGIELETEVEIAGEDLD